MRCYYQIDDGPWRKGYIYTYFTDSLTFKLDEDKSECDLILWRVEIGFCDRKVRISGYERVREESGDYLFKLTAVDVVFHRSHIPKGDKVLP